MIFIKMLNLKFLEVGIINITIIYTVITSSIAMYFTLKIFNNFYFFLLLLCSICSSFTIIGVLMSILKFEIGKIDSQFLTCIPWIIYTQSYLYFLNSYYKDFLQLWQIRLCYLINFINLSAQVVCSTFYCFKLNVSPKTTAKAIEVSENITASSTVLSETIMTFCILSLILKVIKLSINGKVKTMVIKVLLTMIIMWSLDIIVIFLEYSGNRLDFSYITKPMIICFKFYIELLILGNIKKYLFMLSGTEAW
jgi:hypothetical protein